MTESDGAIQKWRAISGWCVTGDWQPAHRRPDWRRRLRASLRDSFVLLREFRLTLTLFAALMLTCTAAFWLWYTTPDTGQRLTLGQAVYGVFSLMFFQPSLEFPDSLGLEILYFVVPVIGLGVLGEGLVRFSMMVFSKRERREEWQVALASTYRNHVIVCGLGKLGYRVACELAALGEEVVGVEKVPERSFVSLLRQNDVPVIVSDARQRDVLVQAGVEHASAVVACTQDDLTNLDIALDARELNPAIKVVMRMFDAELAKKVERGFGIHTAFSVSALAAPAFAAAATRAHVSHSFYVDEMLLNVSQVTIDPGSPLVGKTLAQVEQELELTVVQYKSATKMDLHPDPNIVIEGNDCIAVFAELETLGRLNSLCCAQRNAHNSHNTHTRVGQRPGPSWIERLVSGRPRM
ncbi:MAG: TrkA family potassium uptake protein [Thermoflexales bacterium]|nr:TrkA family potassium uptake protein [Thermoflexales bacterium]